MYRKINVVFFFELKMKGVRHEHKNRSQRMLFEKTLLFLPIKKIRINLLLGFEEIQWGFKLD